MPRFGTVLCFVVISWICVGSAEADLPQSDPYTFPAKLSGAIPHQDVARVVVLAGQGVATAQEELGLLYAFGDGVPQNWKMAADWIGKAAAQGDALATRNLAVLTYLGVGVPRDVRKAVQLFRRAAEAGLPTAEASLGAAYANGIGVPQDWAKALFWTRKAADAGDEVAQAHLGMSYDFGLGVTADPREAARWYAKAVAQKDAQAAVNLALLYTAGRGVPRDPARALALYLLAAKTGSPAGERALAVAYHSGAVVARDDVKAADWMLRAARGGDALAQLLMGSYFVRGIGVAKDDVQAAQWLTAAAKQGLPLAEVLLGASYFDGKGVVGRDLAAAARWLRNGMPATRSFLALPAGQMGLPKGAIASILTQGALDLGWLYQQGMACRATMRAVSWFEVAAKHGSDAAQMNLAVLYWQGAPGVPVDFRQAVRWFGQAAASGNTNAMNMSAMPMERRRRPTGRCAGSRMDRQGCRRRQPDRPAEPRTPLLLWPRWFGPGPCDRGPVAAPRGEAWPAVGRDLRGKPIPDGRRIAARYGSVAGLGSQGSGARRTDGAELLGYSLLIGRAVTKDVPDACVWLQLAVDGSGPGELHDRATVNLRNARALLNDAQNADCDAEAAKLRTQPATVNQ